MAHAVRVRLVVSSLSHTSIAGADGTGWRQVPGAVCAHPTSSPSWCTCRSQQPRVGTVLTVCLTNFSFRIEYEKLHRALKKSHESEKRLIKKCRELNAEIVANAAKVQTALKLSQEDQAQRQKTNERLE